MKKKLFAAMLAACMVLSPAAAFAEEADAPVELNWEDIVAANEESDTDLIALGEFADFDEIAVKIWMPSVLQEVELTDEDKEAGYIGYYMTEDESAIAAVMYVDMDGMDLETYKDGLSQFEGVSNITDVVVNGLEGVGYDLEEADTTCIAFTTEKGYVCEFSFTPASDEEFAAVTGLMISSIQPEE